MATPTMYHPPITSLWTPAAMEATQGLIHARAYQHWRRYEFLLDDSFVADLQQEAWQAALSTTPNDARLCCKIDDACRAYLRYWRLGLRSIGSTTAPRTISKQLPMDHPTVTAERQRSPEMLPEPAAILREALRTIWDACTVPMQLVWCAQLMQNSLSLKRKDYRVMKLNEGKVSRARKALQYLAAHVLFAGMLLALLFWPLWSADASVNLSWNASVTPNVTGYRLYYGRASGAYDTVIDVGMSTTASVDGSLTVGATYFFAATAYNDFGESDYSNEASALIAPADTTPPTVQITSPGNGSTVPRKSSVSIIVNASDDRGVTSVSITVNGQTLCTDQTAPYSCLWNIPAPPNRSYTLQASAVDASGNSASSQPITVTSR